MHENMLNTLRMAKQDVSLAAEQVTPISMAGTPNTCDVYSHDAISTLYIGRPPISLLTQLLWRT